MAIEIQGQEGFVVLEFPNAEFPSRAPRTDDAFTTQPLAFMGVTGGTFFLNSTVDQDLTVGVEVAPSKDGPWIPSGGTTETVAANAGDVILVTTTVGVPVTPWMRLAFTPASAPTAGEIKGKFYREWR